MHSINAIGRRLYELNFGHPNIAFQAIMQQFLSEAALEVDEQKFSSRFLMTEWEEIVDAWQLETWEAYRDVTRLGRKTRLPEKQRAKLWSVFEHVRFNLKARNMITYSELFSKLASRFDYSKHAPFDFIVVDEAQDVSVAQLRLLSQ